MARRTRIVRGPVRLIPWATPDDIEARDLGFAHRHSFHRPAGDVSVLELTKREAKVVRAALHALYKREK